MTTSEKYIEPVIPDLRDIPVERLAELGSSALAYSTALYRERLREKGSRVHRAGRRAVAASGHAAAGRGATQQGPDSAARRRRRRHRPAVTNRRRSAGLPGEVCSR